MRAIIVQNLSLKFILNVEKNCNYLYITPNWIVRWCKPSQAFVMRVKQSELFLMEIDTIAYGQGQTAHGEPWHALEIKPGKAGDHHTCQQKTSLIVSILSSTTFSNNPSTYTHSKLHAYIRWLYLKIYLLNDAPQSLDEPGTKKLRSFYAASMLRRHACQIVHSLTEKTEELSDYTGEKKEELSDMLEVLFAVWVELLLYAGEHCSRESHARHLSNGCEFITILWLMMRHQNYYPALCWESKTLRTSEQDVS